MISLVINIPQAIADTIYKADIEAIYIMIEQLLQGIRKYIIM